MLSVGWSVILKLNPSLFVLFLKVRYFCTIFLTKFTQSRDNCIVICKRNRSTCCLKRIPRPAKIRRDLF